MTPSRSNVTTLAIVVALASLAAPSGLARAEQGEQAACLAAYEKGQVLKEEGKLRAARVELLRCAQPTCPKPVVRECSTWTTEVEAALPTIVVAAAEASGEPVVRAEVTSDGETIASSLDGRPIVLDPGVHVIRVAEGGRVAEERVLVRAGEKMARVNVRFAPKTTPAAEAPMAPPKTASEAPGRSLAPAFVLGGVGVAGLVSFTIFGLRARSEHDDLASSCAPHCTGQQVTDARRPAIVADVSLGVALVALGAAAYFALDRAGHTAAVVGPRSLALSASF